MGRVMLCCACWASRQGMCVCVPARLAMVCLCATAMMVLMGCFKPGCLATSSRLLPCNLSPLPAPSLPPSTYTCSAPQHSLAEVGANQAGSHGSEGCGAGQGGAVLDAGGRLPRGGLAGALPGAHLPQVLKVSVKRRLRGGAQGGKLAAEAWLLSRVRCCPALATLGWVVEVMATTATVTVIVQCATSGNAATSRPAELRHCGTGRLPMLTRSLPAPAGLPSCGAGSCTSCRRALPSECAWAATRRPWQRRCGEWVAGSACWRSVVCVGRGRCGATRGCEAWVPPAGLCEVLRQDLHIFLCGRPHPHSVPDSLT